MIVKQVIYDLAMSFLNKPYIWGGKNPVFGMDCSGLVCELLQAIGIIKNNEEHSAQSLYAVLMQNSEQKIFPEFGSLVFYGRDFQSISHVAFALNEDQIIEAGGGTAATTNMDIAEKTNAYIKVRPYRHRADLLVVINPQYNWGSV